MTWPVKYATGELAQVGDRILYAGERALVEHVVAPDSPEAPGWQREDGGFVVITQSGIRYSLDGDMADMEKHAEFVMRAVDDPNREWQRDWSWPNMDKSGSDEWRKL